MNRVYFASLGFVFAALLQSCGSDGSSDPNITGRSGSNKARLTLSITDAPVSNSTEVWVQFTGLSIKPVAGEAIDFTFTSPMNINLLGLYGSKSEVLISNETIPSGEYEWIRLDVNAENDGVMDSYLVLNDGSTHELKIPSGSTSGLKINNVGFIEPNTHLGLTIDFDLSKSVVLAAGEYLLKPVLRLVNNNTVGSINGKINVNLLTANCSDSDPNTGNAVYIFANNTVPDDIDGTYPDPITVSHVLYDVVSGDYTYEAGFLPEGKYTVAFTCQSDIDDPEANDPLVFSEVTNDIKVESTEVETHTYR